MTNNLEFCSSECHSQYNHDVEHILKHMKYFMLEVIIVFHGVVLYPDKVQGVAILFLLIVIMIFTFSTSDTTSIFGYKKAKIFARFIALILVLLGSLIILF